MKTTTPISGTIPWRLRKDLQWQEIGIVPACRWQAHDPLTRKIYRFGEIERALLERLDGRLSLAQLHEWLATCFAPMRLEYDEIIRLIRLTAQRGLLTYSGPVNSRVVLKLPRDNWGWWVALPWKLLSTKISIANPHVWLEKIAPAFDAFYSKTAVRYWLIAAVVVLMMVLSQWQQAMESIPRWDELFSPRLWLGFGTAFVLTRCVHELGHAICCVRLGARCVDVGVLMMLGIACPYVDVTDSWRLKKWSDRAAIAAAGIYSEMMMATLAGLFWCCSYSGPMHHLAWQIMIVCSISTFLFNANPLMRYDGYYILCDWLRYPNLRDHADRAFQQVIWRLAFGPRSAPYQELDGQGKSFKLVAFGALVLLYRILFLLGIMASIYTTFSYWALSAVGGLMVGVVILSSVAIPIVRGVQASQHAVRKGEQSGLRTIACWSLLLVLLVLLLVIPIPQRTYCRGIVEDLHQAPVYTLAPGHLTAIAANPADAFPKGSAEQPSIRLRNLALEDQLFVSQQRLLQAQSETERLQRLSFSSPESLDQLATAQSRRELFATQHDVIANRLHSLRVDLPNAGNWIWAEATPPQKVCGDGLQRGGCWNAAEQQDRWLDTGTLLGWSVSQQGWCIQSLVSEQDLAHLKLGQVAQVRVQQRPWTVYRGILVGLASQVEAPTPEATATPNEAAPNQYQIRIRLDDPNETVPFLINGSAEVVIKTEGKSLWSLAGDWMARNLKAR